MLNLTEPLPDSGHKLWLDNYYNSPALAHFLKKKKKMYQLCE
jgi:hypothetical protein